jgi:hypothetical protein
MPNLRKQEAIAPNSFWIRDCYTWAEINYLDSPSDYREYLPENNKAAAQFNERKQASSRSDTKIFYALVITLAAISLVLGYLIGLIMNMF